MDVICVRDDFPIITSTGHLIEHKGEQALSYPQVGEILEVSEELGDFYRFDKYDSVDAFNWWHKSRFEPFYKPLYYLAISRSLSRKH